MGRDLGPNPARYNGPCRLGTKLFRVVPCLGRAFFSVLRAGPPDPAQMYTYSWLGVVAPWQRDGPLPAACVVLSSRGLAARLDRDHRTRDK
jgi:hypothetical protein